MEAGRAIGCRVTKGRQTWCRSESTVSPSCRSPAQMHLLDACSYFLLHSLGSCTVINVITL